MNRDHINRDHLIEPISIIKSNGKRAMALIIKPKSKRVRATFLYLPGRDNNLVDHYESIVPLVSDGFQILMMDYRGYGLSAGKPTHIKVLDDGYSALDYLNSLGSERTSKIFIYGLSYGGFLAAVIGSNRQEMIAGIVIQGIFCSPWDKTMHWALGFKTIFTKRLKVIDEIKKNFKPILVIHSSLDHLVSLELGRKIYLNANQPKEFLEKDEGEKKDLPEYERTITSRIIKFLCKS